jgi:hypothetical protein
MIATPPWRAAGYDDDETGFLRLAGALVLRRAAGARPEDLAISR